MASSRVVGGDLESSKHWNLLVLRFLSERINSFPNPPYLSGDRCGQNFDPPIVHRFGGWPDVLISQETQTPVLSLPAIKPPPTSEINRRLPYVTYEASLCISGPKAIILYEP